MPTTPFTHEHVALADSVRRLVEGPLAGAGEAAEAGGHPFSDVLHRCGEIGLFDLGDPLAEVVVAAGLGRLRSGGLVRVILDTMLTSALGLAPLEEAVAVVPDTSVDVQPNGASGHLAFVPGGGFAGRVLVLDAGIVIGLAEGAVTPLDQAHALRGSAPASVTFESAGYERVDVDPAAIARWELAVAAAAVAGAWQTWQDAVAYARQRQAFGRPIARFQVNRHSLADAAAKLTASEALVHDAAVALAAGDSAQTATALLYASATAVTIADRGLQLHGGNGYTTGFDAARAWRDARELRVRAPHLRRRIAGEGVRP